MIFFEASLSALHILAHLGFRKKKKYFAQNPEKGSKKVSFLQKSLAPSFRRKPESRIA
jgi:hypothetical protein